GAAAHRGQRRLRPAAGALEGVVAAGGAHDRADDDALVHQPGDAREDLADLDARDVRVDRAELPADLARGVHLEVPHVLVGRSTTEEDIDDRLVRRRRAGAGLGPEHVGQRQRGGAEGERPDLEEAAAGDAVAVATLLAPNREHGQVTPFVRVAGPGG